MHADHNLYPGINPHLNSYLQQTAGGWESFHAELVVQTRMALDEQLPDGYLALAEKSLQISEISPPTRIRPDVTVYQQTPTPQPADFVMATTPTLTLAVQDTLAVTEYLTAVAIYETNTPLGKPITRLEILSPANMAGGSHHAQYLQKRQESLQAGLALVEVDYLHETLPILSQLDAYSNGGWPYHIIVSNPRPVLTDGVVAVYSFGVLDPIPRVPIPLTGTEALVFDFGAVYQRVFTNLRLCAAVVDYAVEPARFEAYLRDDQVRIRAFMAQVVG